MSFGLERDFVLKVLFLGIVGLDAQFQCRLFRFVQALIFGVRAGSLVHLFRALRSMPGGVGRFLSCSVGANHCRLRHTEWEKSGHGLTTRPRETASEEFLSEMLYLFRCPPRSAAALLEVLFLFGTVQVGLLVGFPLGASLLMGMLLVWLLKRVRGFMFCGWSIVFLQIVSGFRRWW